jgi:hypothetical protein
MDTGLGSTIATTTANTTAVSPNSFKAAPRHKKKKQSSISTHLHCLKHARNNQLNEMTTSNDDEVDERSLKSNECGASAIGHMLKIDKTGKDGGCEENSYMSDFVRINSLSGNDNEQTKDSEQTTARSFVNDDKRHNDLEQMNYFESFSRTQIQGMSNETDAHTLDAKESEEDEEDTLVSSDTETTTIKTEDYLNSFNKYRYSRMDFEIFNHL